jgi:hypothetical protein
VTDHDPGQGPARLTRPRRVGDLLLSLALGTIGIIAGGAVAAAVGVRTTLIVGGAIAAVTAGVALVPGVRAPDSRKKRSWSRRHG